MKQGVIVRILWDKMYYYEKTREGQKEKKSLPSLQIQKQRKKSTDDTENKFNNVHTNIQTHTHTTINTQYDGV